MSLRIITFQLWEPLILKVIIGRLLGQKPNSSLVSPIRNKDSRNKDSNETEGCKLCFVTEDKSFLVRAVACSPLSHRRNQ